MIFFHLFAVLDEITRIDIFLMLDFRHRMKNPEQKHRLNINVLMVLFTKRKNNSDFWVD